MTMSILSRSKLVLFLFLFLFSIPLVSANVEVFSSFDTVMTINSNNTVDIKKALSLKNVFDVGIVPGQVEFKVARGEEGGANNIEIVEASAVDQYGTPIKTTIRNGDQFSVIVLDVFYPLLPGFEYGFELDYRFSYQPEGIFFKSLNVPLRESTIPIEDGTFRVNLPQNTGFTYISEEGYNGTVDKAAVWMISDNTPQEISFEYSFLPVKTAGFARGSYVFWIIVNLILLAVLIFEIRRGIRRIRAQYAEAEQEQWSSQNNQNNGK